MTSSEDTPVAQASKTIAAAAQSKPRSLVTKFADRYSVDPDKLLTTLRATAFKQRKDNVIVTNEQMMALLVVADQYGLNPFTKEIFAFEDKGAIIPVVSVDGWSRIINSHSSYDGIEFRYSDETVTMAGGKLCPEWCEAVIHHKNRTHPTVVREYLDEVYVEKRGANGGYAGPWQTHTKRMLRHKTLIQGARVAFGFAGIFDEDEAGRIMETITPEPSSPASTGGGSTADLQAQLQARARAPEPEPVDAEWSEHRDEDAADGPSEEAGSAELMDPEQIIKLIQSAKTDDDITPLLDLAAAWKDEDESVWKDLTRKVLGRRSAIITGDAD